MKTLFPGASITIPYASCSRTSAFQLMIVDNQQVMRAQIPGTIVLEHVQDQMVHARLDF